jgi:hypothetical protein
MLYQIGAILIIVGFILGVYCGIMLSLRSVIISESNEVKQGKMAGISLLCVVAVIMFFIGQYLFFTFH